MVSSKHGTILSKSPAVQKLILSREQFQKLKYGNINLRCQRDRCVLWLSEGVGINEFSRFIKVSVL